jgi:hypothetical protein
LVCFEYSHPSNFEKHVNSDDTKREVQAKSFKSRQCACSILVRREQARVPECLPSPGRTCRSLHSLKPLPPRHHALHTARKSPLLSTRIFTVAFTELHKAVGGGCTSATYTDVCVQDVGKFPSRSRSSQLTPEPTPAQITDHKHLPPLGSEWISPQP